MSLADLELRSTTDLSKKTKDVLEDASVGLVLITREKPNSDIAMLRHETFKSMWAAYSLMPQFLNIMKYIAASNPRSLPPPVPPTDLDWLATFESEQLQEFSGEYMTIAMRILKRELPMSAIEDLLTQWRHSAEVLEDDDLQARLEQARVHIREGM